MQRYTDSIEFTEDLVKVARLLANVSGIVTSERWRAWMLATDTNYGTRTAPLNDLLVHQVKTASSTASQLSDMLYSVD